MKRGYIRFGKLLLFTILSLFAINGAIAGGRQGGGDFGYGDEILNQVKIELITKLTTLNEDNNQVDIVKFYVEKNLPTENEIRSLELPHDNFQFYPAEKVDMEFLVGVIHNLKMLPEKFDSKARYMRFGQDANGTYHIEALRDFFTGYGVKPFKNHDYPTQNEIRRKLLHEASHNWGYDDKRAKDFSEFLMQELYNPVSNGLTQFYKPNAIQSCIADYKESHRKNQERVADIQHALIKGTLYFLIGGILVCATDCGDLYTASREAKMSREVYNVLVESQNGFGENLVNFYKRIQSQNYNMTLKKLKNILNLADSRKRFCENGLMSLDSIEKRIIEKTLPEANLDF